MIANRKTSAIAASALVSLAVLGMGGAAQARQGVVHVRGAQGGATAVAGQRGVAARAHGTDQAADGTVTHASGGAYRGTNGSAGYRASQTTVSPDGTVSRSGQAAASGARGSASSAGSFTRAADGTLSGSRSTQATSATTGNSYSGSTTIDPATGQPAHTGTCTNAAGEVISCR